ncbi:50S ribosomal protein L25 [Candidatus Saccharibacteria bacterium]|nr:50S ribosomal protein L25 [Candidatus Saccharibacteria bacterium]
MSEKLVAVTRTAAGKQAKKLRAKGLVIGVISGKGVEPMLWQAEYLPAERALVGAGYATPLDVSIDGKDFLSMVKNVELQPATGKILNVELQAISKDSIVWAETPIELIGLGQSEAEKMKLNILQVLETLEVKAKPADLPEAIEVDVTKLATVDDRITLADVVLPKGVELADKELSMDTVIANVYDAAAEAAAEEAREAQAKAEAEAAATVEGGATTEGGGAPAAEGAEAAPAAEK